MVRDEIEPHHRARIGWSCTHSGALRGAAPAVEASWLSGNNLGCDAIGRPPAAAAPQPKRLALIGARGFTGQTLTTLLSDHPHLELTHVSSRQLEGYSLTEYTKKDLKYSNLSVEDVERMEKDGEVDAWVMALPNGICKPFVDAVDRGAKARTSGEGSVVVDLSADYRFEDGWTYGLPGETPSPSSM